MRLRRPGVVGATISWVVFAGAVRIGVLAPERCPAVTPAAIDRSVGEAVGWLGRALKGDGRFLYDYDRASRREVPGYNSVRHGAVAMSLYQVGTPEARRIADRATEYVRANLVRHKDWSAFALPRENAKLGAMAVVVAGLAYRRETTGDGSHDDLLREGGRFMRAQQLDDGSFLAFADRVTGEPVPGITSLYSTGEAFFALAKLHNLFPGEGWDEPVRKAARYVAVDRDREEFPSWGPWADQWAAYAYGEMRTWGLSAEDVTYVRRLSGRFGFLLRGESQRRERGVQQFIRKGPARGGGFGTVVEALPSLWRVTGEDERLRDLRAPLAERARCAAGMAVDRQQRGPSAAADPFVRGAWYIGDRTRMDDQQHMMSGLLHSREVLTAR